MNTNKKRVMLVDDHPLFRRGLGTSINASSGFEVCGEAGNSREALRVIRSSMPQAVMVDISLPGPNGIELIKIFKAEMPDLFILVLSMHSDSNYVIRALKAGARGYILKGESADIIIKGLHQVFAGTLFMSETMYERLIFRAIRTLDVSMKTPFDRLTKRELQIFGLLGQGLDKQQIADRLDLSSKTVDSHRYSVCSKLCCTTMEELVAFAFDWQTYQAANDLDDTPALAGNA